MSTPAHETAPHGDAATFPKIAYLTNLYPSVSHTFIRREIQGLEKLGYKIVRYAVRCGERFVDDADVAEFQRTYYLIEGPEWILLIDALPDLFFFLPGLPRALRAMLQMNRRSERGLIRHVAYLFEAARLAQHAKSQGIQHIHVHFGTNAASVARLAYLLGGPTYSFAVHGPDEFDTPLALSLSDKIRDARFVVAITDYCAAQLMRWCDFDQWHKIARVRCTVPDEWFDHSHPVSGASRQFVCVGRLSGQKGQLLLLEALRLLLDQGHEATVVLVGDGEMRPQIEAQIQALHLENHVTITGWQTEAQVREHLRASRALVMASFAEGLPMVIMEAMAMQRPVVVTKVAGVPELVHSGKHGWKVIAGSPQSLADGMAAALDASEEQLRAMGAAGAEQVRARHSVPSQVAVLDDLFRTRL